MDTLQELPKRQVDIRLQLSPEEYETFNKAIYKFARTQGKYHATYKEFIMGLSKQVSEWEVV